MRVLSSWVVCSIKARCWSSGLKIPKWFKTPTGFTLCQLDFDGIFVHPQDPRISENSYVSIFPHTVALARWTYHRSHFRMQHGFFFEKVDSVKFSSELQRWKKNVPIICPIAIQDVKTMNRVNENGIEAYHENINYQQKHVSVPCNS